MYYNFFPGKMIIKKWTNLRDSYRRYAKKQLASQKKTSSAAKSAYQYTYWNSMHFLDDIMQQRQTTSSNVGEGSTIKIEADLTVNSELEDTRRQDVEHELRPQKRKESKKSPMPKQPKRLRAEPAIPEVERIIVSKLGDSESRHLSFFRSLLPTVERFSESQTFHYQSELLKLTQHVSNMSQPNPLPYPCISHSSSGEDLLKCIHQQLHQSQPPSRNFEQDVQDLKPEIHYHPIFNDPVSQRCPSPSSSLSSETADPLKDLSFT